MNHRREMGLKPARDDLSQHLGTGNMFELFHSLGSLPVVKDRLSNQVSEGAMVCAEAFSILPDTSSGPIAFFIFTESSNLPDSTEERQGIRIPRCLMIASEGRKCG